MDAMMRILIRIHQPNVPSKFEDGVDVELKMEL